MLEISEVNYSNPTHMRAKKVAFKNNPNGLTQNQVPVAAMPVAGTVAATSAKHIINLVPDSYLDEIGGAALAAGLAVLTHGKNQKVNQKIAELTEGNSALQKTVDSLKGGAKKAVDEAKEAVKGFMTKSEFEGQKLDIMSALGKETDAKIASREPSVMYKMGMETDAKIASRIAEISSNSLFPRATVKIKDDFSLTLATCKSPLGESSPQYADFIKDLRVQSAKSVLGLRRFSKPTTDTSFIRMVAVELKPFNSVGGLASIPKEMAEELPKIINQTKNGARFIMDTPMYTGRVGANNGIETIFTLVKDKNGAFKYQKMEGGKVKESFNLTKIDEFYVPIVGEKPQKVRLFQTQIDTKPVEFSQEVRKLFKPELLSEIDERVKPRQAEVFTEKLREGIKPAILEEMDKRTKIVSFDDVLKAEEGKDKAGREFSEELIKKINDTLSKDEEFVTDNYRVFKKGDTSYLQRFYETDEYRVFGKGDKQYLLVKKPSFETDNYRVFTKDGKQYFQTKLTYNLWDNEKFALDLPLDKTPSIYQDGTQNSGLVDREVYFDKYIYEHTIKMLSENENGQCVKDGKAVLGADAFVLNDWHTGPLAAMMRLGTIGKKYQQGLRPDVAEKATNMPIVSLLHNTYDSEGDTGSIRNVEHMLNVMFGENAASVVPNAFMPNIHAAGREGLPMNLANACLGGDGRAFSCLNMLAQFSDSMHPVSDGYAKEVATIREFGNDILPIYHLRTKKGLDAETVRAFAKNNGIDASEFSDAELTRSTFYGIDNGLNKVNNILTDQRIKEVNDVIGHDVGLIPYSDELAAAAPEKALEWKQHNKKAVLSFFIDSVNGATGREKSGKLNAWLGDMTNLSGVTEHTPIYTTAGRISQQKGYETYLGGVKKYIMSLPKDDAYDYPVFITQGEIPQGDKYARDVVNLVEQTKKDLINAGYKKAADRIVLLDRGNGGYYTITKLVTDSPVMASNYEPCGLTHKEFMNMAGGVTLGHITGGIPSGLPDSAIVKIPFNKTSSQETKIDNFAEGLKQMVGLYADKHKWAEGIQASLATDFTWAKEGNSGFKYIDALAQKGALTLPQ